VVLIWPLYNSVYPVPAYPNNLWPYAVLAWIVIGMALLVGRPTCRGRMCRRSPGRCPICS
jgi:hypothetical protein